MRVLITGSAGFIGHHVVEHILKNTDWEVISLDRLDISGNLNRLADIPVSNYPGRVHIIFHDLKAPINSLIARDIGNVDYILHLAASSHVDRSIADPLSFVMDNVVGTCNLLNYARELPSLRRMIYFSTDEVFGAALDGVRYTDWDRYKSGNPYSATKAGAEELCVAFHNTYQLPVIILHCMNVIGERQHPEKYLPLVIRNIQSGSPSQVHAIGGKTGSRCYIHARNAADATLYILKHGEIGDKYNIDGQHEINNLDLGEMVAKIIGKPFLYEFSTAPTRPGHDFRYALDGTKLEKLGWKPPIPFEVSLRRTVLWTIANPRWL